MHFTSKHEKKKTRGPGPYTYPLQTAVAKLETRDSQTAQRANDPDGLVDQADHKFNEGDRDIASEASSYNKRRNNGRLSQVAMKKDSRKTKLHPFAVQESTSSSSGRSA